MPAKTIIIGSGIAGLSSACCLAKQGLEVTVVEKNAMAGGRASVFEEKGFRFDMGPSWYWMPEVFEKFYSLFDRSAADFYDLKRLDPSYAVYYGPGDVIHMPASREGISALFESIEKGSGKKLDRFLNEARYKYELGMGKLVYKPGLSVTEFLNSGMLGQLPRMHLLRSFRSYVRSNFRSPRIAALLEFPVLFLGASPARIPALYSLMNYADMELGTWYPMGGMYRVVEAMKSIADSLGVQFIFDAPVERIEVIDGSANRIVAGGRSLAADHFISGADYHHTEQALLKEAERSYSAAYWKSRTLAPSCLIFYVGVSKRVNGLLHHNLFFDEDFGSHLHELFVTREWPAAPLFYVSCPSKTDDSVAPPGCENLFILIPVSPGLTDNDDVRDHYFDMVLGRIEKITGESIRPHIVSRRSYAHRNFIDDYNAYQGNGYGLANTLRQTSVLRPAIRSKKVKNLYFTGQFTVPGPGVPPAIISGQVTAAEVLKACRKYESIV